MSATASSFSRFPCTEVYLAKTLDIAEPQNLARHLYRDTRYASHLIEYCTENCLPRMAAILGVVSGRGSRSFHRRLYLGSFKNHDDDDDDADGNVD